jgi:hypothetical protein
MHEKRMQLLRQIAVILLVLSIGPEAYATPKRLLRFGESRKIRLGDSRRLYTRLQKPDIAMKMMFSVKTPANDLRTIAADLLRSTFTFGAYRIFGDIATMKTSEPKGRGYIGPNLYQQVMVMLSIKTKPVAPVLPVTFFFGPSLSFFVDDSNKGSTSFSLFKKSTVPATSQSFHLWPAFVVGFSL